MLFFVRAYSHMIAAELRMWPGRPHGGWWRICLVWLACSVLGGLETRVQAGEVMDGWMVRLLRWPADRLRAAAPGLEDTIDSRLGLRQGTRTAGGGRGGGRARAGGGRNPLPRRPAAAGPNAKTLGAGAASMGPAAAEGSAARRQWWVPLLLGWAVSERLACAWPPGCRARGRHLRGWRRGGCGWAGRGC